MHLTSLAVRSTFPIQTKHIHFFCRVLSKRSRAMKRDFSAPGQAFA